MPSDFHFRKITLAGVRARNQRDMMVETWASVRKSGYRGGVRGLELRQTVVAMEGCLEN